MAATAESILELAVLTHPVGADVLPIVVGVAGTPTTKRVTLENLAFRDIEDITDGTTVVGQARIIAANDVAGAAITLIANGTRDVTTVLHAQVVVKPSAGAADAGVVFILNNSSTPLYDDGGTNVLTLTCNADGSLEVQRTAGTLTYDVILDAIWI